jgi:peptidyl-prolyl cis-trans isomerase C
MDKGGRQRERARAIWREPLVHFLIGGIAIFLFSMWRGPAVDPASRTIDVTEEQVASLSADWEQMWRRRPSSREIDAMISDYIKEEIYYREARRLGLDEDDNVIRRRLRSKMEFLAAAEVESARPDDATLGAWLQKHAARFAPDAAYSFDQIYLGPKDAGKAAAILKTVSSGGNWMAQGETISLPKSLEYARRSEVERQFGGDFAKSVEGLSPGVWAGPVASGYGVHLVRVRDVRAPSRPQLADVRQAVENDWRAATYKKREAKAYQALLDGYTIRIAKP